MVERLRGGAPVGGQPIGLLMLDTRFPRPPGDVGNLATWEFPVLVRVVRGALAAEVVGGSSEGLLPAFAQAARGLVADGAVGVVANCGFLVHHQRALAEAAGVPVLASSLMQLPLVEALLPPGQRAGVLTISAENLKPSHLQAAGARPDTAVAGVPLGGALAGPILGGGDGLDLAAAEAEMVAAGRGLAAREGIGAIVMECTNMAPYAPAIQRETGLPVYSMVTLVRWFRAGLVPPAF